MDVKRIALPRPEPSKAIRSISSVLLVGIIGFAIPFSRPVFQAMTPIVILLAVIGSIRYHDGDRNLKMILVSLFILLAGFSIEVIGVKTGIIFGTYSYGKVLGPKLMGTPVIIGLNWLLLIYTARAMVEYWDTSEWIKVPVVAILVTAFDIVLEPVAIKLGFWSWEAIQVPLQNYLAWFGIALIFSSLMTLSKVKLMNEMGGPLFFMLFLFFLVLNIVILFI
ncbi:carotenoid biosynthesis protein [Saccharicrinis sp. FJH62]|uniref:carotenoid biosynthesis protein n=1 Tax=Saccharicrinis sp. FJH62 TaxID=3344657 RepID=UPI0035D41B4C